MLGAVRVRGEVPAQVNKAVEVEPGCVEKTRPCRRTAGDGNPRLHKLHFIQSLL